MSKSNSILSSLSPPVSTPDSGPAPPTVLEAKLSHDLAYYRYFDQIAALSEKVANLRTLIADLQDLPHDTSQDGMQAYLQRLKTKYSQSAKQYSVASRSHA